jgi:hypothetical protein
MNWIRIAVAIGDDPDIHELAEALGVRVAEAVGLVVGTLVRFPEHAPDGNLAQLRDSLIERWAGWEGDRGKFAAELRRIFLSPEGKWESWDKHNGKALQKLERDRERLRQKREDSENVARQLRDTRQSVAGTDGRTDEVQLRGGYRRKALTPEPFRTDPFCKKCGGGMGKAHESATRLTIIHREDCPDA